jgi:carbon monoxide dehydrogenase subunit G
MSGSISGCADPNSNDPAFRARYGLTVTQVADTSATLTFSFVDQGHNGIICTLSGPLTHFGRLYKLNAQQSCTGPGQDNTPYAVTVDSLHPTGQGIEGHLTASVGAGCMATLHFAAVRNVNN